MNNSLCAMTPTANYDSFTFTKMSSSFEFPFQRWTTIEKSKIAFFGTDIIKYFKSYKKNELYSAIERIKTGESHAETITISFSISNGSTYSASLRFYKSGSNYQIDFSQTGRDASNNFLIFTPDTFYFKDQSSNFPYFKSGFFSLYLTLIPYSYSSCTNVCVLFRTHTLTTPPLDIYQIDAYGNWPGVTDISPFFLGLSEYYGEDSVNAGGLGDFNDNSDTIDFPNLPSKSALSTKMVNMYCPTEAELQDLRAYLWSTDFVNLILKLFQDPVESLISLNIFPVEPLLFGPATAITLGNAKAFKTVDGVETDLTAVPLASQYLTFDCGTLNLHEYWGSALDYSPYTKCEIFIPFVGVQSLDIDDVMHSTISLKYNIDFLTGVFSAMLKIDKVNMNLSSVLYHYTGKMCSAIPITSANYNAVITNITSSLVSTVLPIALGSPASVLAGGLTSGIMNTANAKTHIEKSGSVTMEAAMLDIQTPYLVLTRPIQAKPEDYQKLKGWQSNTTMLLSNVEGYTEVEYCRITSENATEDEKTEIYNLLRAGVIL